MPSTVRLSRLDCLESQLLFARLGRVAGKDAVVVKQVRAEQIKLEF